MLGVRRTLGGEIKTIPKGMISWDSKHAKTKYATVHGLNGCIFREMSGGTMPDLSVPFFDAANVKPPNPELDCATRNDNNNEGGQQ